MTETCHCIVCARRMPNFEPDRIQPMGGTAFQSPGYYGSTVFDPMDGRMIEVVVCDPCLVAAKAAGRVYGATDEISDTPQPWAAGEKEPADG